MPSGSYFVLVGNTDWPDVAASGLVGRLPATEPSILMGSAYYDAAIPNRLEYDPFA